MKETGTVKFFNDAKGFGFIAREGKPDIFVHFTGIADKGNGRRTIFEGDTVEFEMGQGPRGACAMNVSHV